MNSPPRDGADGEALNAEGKTVFVRAFGATPGVATRAERMPEDKQRIVRDLKAAGIFSSPRWSG
ncbi:hypothetical protein CCR94_21430 [Rhodoblastus sphagnicola]|uniref:Uncharacterized protein n=1 Tax=Rhodoblastus sphagnicola TaxID=333368 RepID=A0A2S6MX89_9HYPH|nr:hypothetical protein [Rhodoblastus sphagnicola]MBB4199322.1 cation transport ATPase [Rhodoblastus sphagnicola]PPQ26984.1 hypothetical protein CCR94_21430 [Rhodoblastus sphagnicola]